MFTQLVIKYLNASNVKGVVQDAGNMEMEDMPQGAHCARGTHASELDPTGLHGESRDGGQSEVFWEQRWW